MRTLSCQLNDIVRKKLPNTRTSPTHAYRALTRLRSAARAHEHVYKAVERSLGKLGTEYLDAYYIHSPLASPAQRAKAWCVGGVRGMRWVVGWE